MKTSKNKLWAFVAITFLIFSFSSCNSQTNGKAALPYSKSFLVDVRTPEEFNEGTAPGAVNIPLNTVESRLAEFQGKEQIVLFCRSGNRSSQAYSILEKNGLKNIVNGGTWQDVKKVVEAEQK